MIRIGDKLINPDRIHRSVDQILTLRQNGLSQQEVAERLGVDRTLVSRLEGLGEIRKGPRMALIGFPVANTEEITSVARDEGVDFILIMNEEERWNYVQEKNGAELINHFMNLISQVKEYDSVIFIGSDMRNRMMEAILGPKVINWEIGASPLKESYYINPDKLRQLVRQLRKTG
ncbi:MAG: helix-turn-helix domain-containing protein [Bacillota bacterium]